MRSEKKTKNNVKVFDAAESDLVDVYVGKKLKERRIDLGCTQERLAQSVGITFQQVQKYERGVNRIGASRLYQFSRALKVPVSYFFEGCGVIPLEERKSFPYTSVREDESLPPSYICANYCSIYNNPNSFENSEIIDAFEKISDSKVRKDVLNLIRTLSTASKDAL